MTDQTSREAVLDAARDLFTSKGFANTSVREICGNAGVTPPSLYYHFGSKEGLFEAVVEETVQLDDFCRRLSEAVEGADDPWEKLRAYFHAYLQQFPDDVLNPGLHLQRSTALNPTSLRQIGPGISQIHEVTKQLLETGMTAGAFRQVDVDSVAACLVGLIDSFVRARVYLGVDYDTAQIEACMVDLLALGLKS